MRRTVTKLAMNKATFLSLSNQMTEQLGAWGLRGRGAAYMGGQRRKCGRVAAAQAQTPPGPQAQPLRAVHCPSLRPAQPPPPAPPLPCAAAMTRVAGSLAKSGEVLKLVNSLMKVPQLHRTMVEMSRGARGRRASLAAAAGGPGAAASLRPRPSSGALTAPRPACCPRDGQGGYHR